MERFLEGRRFHYIACFLVAVATLVVYSNSFTAAFHFDDIPHIVENYRIRSLHNIPALLFSSRGVTIATFALNYAVGGINVVGYHLVNTAIHIANGIMLYFLVFLTLNITRNAGGDVDDLWSKRIAICAALLFAVHPVQTQAVTYLVQRMEILASLFYLLALLLFIKGAATSSAERRALLYGGVMLSYILGFASKEIAITLPAILLLYDFTFISRGNLRGLLKRWPLYGALTALLIIFVIKTLIPLGGFSDVSAASAGFGVKSIAPLEYLFTQFNVLIYYIILLIVPRVQNLDYDFPVSHGLFEMPQIKDGTALNFPLPPPFVSLIVLLLVVGCSIYLCVRSACAGGRRGRIVSFFIFWFFILLSPTSSFIPIVDVIFEHRLYLASAGFFVILAIGLDALFLKGEGALNKEGS
ncbi:MAG: hypothetical protein GY721_09940 [Deltaproteobacteria bacterium]|nr:hypothetical protein [Deltaproteobacteria bacterium]